MNNHRLDCGPPEAISDIGLLRFLRGYAHDVPAAANAFKLGVEWRSTHDAYRWRPLLMMKKDVEKATFEEIVEHYTDLSRLPHWNKVGIAYPERFFHEHDRYGNPIMITTHDMIENVFALMTVVTKEEYDEFRVARAVNNELYLDALSRNMKRLVKAVYIWDLEDMTRSLWKTWENKSVKAFWSDWDHRAAIAFPEQAHRIVAVNVPSWLMVLWKMLRSVIPGRTLRKIHVLGTAGVAEALLKRCEIPASSLPKRLGGTCEYTAKYFARPRPISEFKTGTIEIPAGAARTIEFDFDTSGTLYWSLFVHSGRELEITKTACGNGRGSGSKGQNKLMETFKITEEFHREVFETPDHLSGTMFSIKLNNQGSLFFSKTVEFVFAPFPDVFHDTSAISQE